MSLFPDRIQKHFDREEKANADELQQATDELKQIAVSVAAMLNVTIPNGKEPEGAVAALIEALSIIEWEDFGGHGGVPECPWCLGDEQSGHRGDCLRQAALARFEVDGTDARADTDAAADANAEGR